MTNWQVEVYFYPKWNDFIEIKTWLIMFKGIFAERAFEVFNTNTVTRRDTDSNNHANNIAYLEWAMDNIPGAIYDNYKVVNMKTSYKRECLQGMHLIIDTYENINPQNEFTTSVSNYKDGTLLVGSNFIFEKV